MLAAADGKAITVAGNVVTNPIWDWGGNPNTYVALDYLPDPGDLISVKDELDDDWEIRVFVVLHQGVYYCENPFDGNIGLVGWSHGGRAPETARSDI